MLLDDTALLRSIPILSGLNDEQLKIIAFSSTRETFREGQVLFREGDFADRGYVVRSGSVLLTQTVDRAEVERAVYGPGSLVGELAMLTDIRRPATAVARSDSSFMVITRELFHRVLEAYPELALKLHQSIRARVLELSGTASANRAQH